MPELSADLYGTVSHKLDALQPSGIREFNKEVSKIPGIIKLTLGEPDMATPEHVKQAAIRSIEEDDSHYAPQMGKPELLEAISDYIQNTRDVHYDPQTEIIATVGATEALDATLFAILNTGDKVVVPTPIFSLYFPLIEMTGATVVQVDTSADNFVLTPEKLEEVLEEEGKGVKAVGRRILPGCRNPAATTVVAALRRRVPALHGAQPCRQIPRGVIANNGNARTLGAFQHGFPPPQIFAQRLNVGIMVPCRDFKTLILKTARRHDGTRSATDMQQQSQTAFLFGGHQAFPPAASFPMRKSTRILNRRVAGRLSTAMPVSRSMAASVAASCSREGEIRVNQML